jgi:hypothetical protein
MSFDPSSYTPFEHSLLRSFETELKGRIIASPVEGLYPECYVVFAQPERFLMNLPGAAEYESSRYSVASVFCKK